MNEITRYDYHAALKDFERARRQAALQQTLARLRGEPSELLKYDEVRKKLKVTGVVEQGIQEIPLDAIVGSVGRSSDYTRDFMPTQDSDEYRWATVKAAFVSQVGVPPIEVYQIGDAYFVKDGNHRVSVARQLGNEAIEAYVTEVRTRVPLSADDDPKEIILKERYANFLEMTDIDNLRPGADLKMTWPGYYYLLLEEIDVHRYFMGIEQQREIPYAEAVGSWYDNVFLPVLSLLYERGLFHQFPGRTEADLYALLADYRRELGEQLGWQMDAETAVSKLSEDKGESTGSVITRVSDRLADVVIPHELEPGPKPGIWREERLESITSTSIFKDLLVALGGEESHWQTLEHALTLARRSEGRVLGLYVAWPQDELTPEEQLAQGGLIDAIKNEFNRRCEEAGVRYEFAVDWGTPADAILRRSVWADLVVFSMTHPPSDKAVARLRSGLTPLLQSCSRPLLAVPSTAHSNLDKMLLAYDGSPKSEEGLFIAAYRAMKYGHSLVVLVVSDERVTVDTGEKAREYLDRHGVENYEIIVKVSHDAGRLILETAQQYDCNMLIMGGFGRRPFWRIVLGSLVDQMLREFPQPILISR
ncbi:MAG: universal stress protein UspA [Chloroflexi bacterium]|nr:MAG: universal stress protein UspA [Chloroflexota bacterium]